MHLPTTTTTTQQTSKKQVFKYLEPMKSLKTQKKNNYIHSIYSIHNARSNCIKHATKEKRNNKLAMPYKQCTTLTTWECVLYKQGAMQMPGKKRDSKNICHLTPQRNEKLEITKNPGG